MSERQKMISRETIAIIAAVAVGTIILGFALSCRMCLPDKEETIPYSDEPEDFSWTRVWCIDFQLKAGNPFLAIRRSDEIEISRIPFSLTSKTLELGRNNTTKSKRNMIELPYFLLPGNVLTGHISSSAPGASFEILTDSKVLHRVLESGVLNIHKRGEHSVENFRDVTANFFQKQDSTKTMEEDNLKNINSLSDSDMTKPHEIPVSSDGSPTFSFEFKVNRTDVYFIIIRHKGPSLTNSVSIDLFLNSSAYIIEQDIHKPRICNEDTSLYSCTVPLKLASKLFIKIMHKNDNVFNLIFVCKPRFTLYFLLFCIIPATLLTGTALFLLKVRIIVEEKKRRSASSLHSEQHRFRSGDQELDAVEMQSRSSDRLEILKTNSISYSPDHNASENETTFDITQDTLPPPYDGLESTAQN